MTQYHRVSFGESSNTDCQLHIVEHACRSWSMGEYRKVALRNGIGSNPVKKNSANLSRVGLTTIFFTYYGLQNPVKP